MPVIPVGLRGLWGSVFSYDGGYPMTHLPKRFRSLVTVCVGDTLEPTVSAEDAREAVAPLILAA